MPESDTWLKTIYRKNDDVVLRRVAGEYVLVPICRNACSVQRMFTLNETGGMILVSMDGGKTLEEILDLLLESFAVERSVAEPDMREVVNDLERIGAVCRVGTAT